MNAKELYQNFLTEIQTVYNVDEANIITDWVFEDILNIKKFDVIKNPTQTISENLNTLLNETKQALLEHKPIQYILGKTTFCKMQFKVDENVLIPRPETEELVNLIIEEYKLNSGKINILDIGTGSGCIAIALKKYLPAAEVTAIDVSNGALTLANENAANNNVKIHFKNIDFLDEESCKPLPIFDIIVSNPPYIPINEKQKMNNNVIQYEPHLALFVPDNNPLLFYKMIAQFGLMHLNSNGKIVVETHEDYTKKVAAIFAATYKNVIIKKDIFEKERFVIATLN